MSNTNRCYRNSGSFEMGESMGKVELEMKRIRHTFATRYLQYAAPMPGHTVWMLADLSNPM